MYKRKQYISLFLLVFFMFIKTAGLHALSHSESDLTIDDCDLCEFVVTSNETPFNTTIQVLSKPIITNYCNKPLPYYYYKFTQKEVNNTQFCRPPPTL